MPPDSPINWPQRCIILTGGAGFLGRCVQRVLLARGVPTVRFYIPRSRNVDLTDQLDTRDRVSHAFPGRRADIIIHCAGRVVGLGANRERPADFFLDIMAMALNLADAARRDGFHERDGRFVMVGSMTSYPADAAQPLHETYLFRGYPDPQWPNARRIVDDHARALGWRRIAQADFLGVFRTPGPTA